MITVVGEALVDLVATPGSATFTAHPGGSPANVAVGLARLGIPVTLATQLGDDVLGNIVASHVREAGLALDLLPAGSAATSLGLAVLDEAGSAVYDFRLDWDITRAPDLPPDCQCVHTGSLGLSLLPGADVVEDFVRRIAGSVLVSYDPNVRPSLAGSRDAERERVERQVRTCDVVKASLDDVRWLYPERGPEEVAATWLETGPSLVVITLGASGAYAVNRSGSVTRPSRSVRVVDTVGAGDAFTAGLLTALADKALLDVEARRTLAAAGRVLLAELLDFSSEVSAATCERAGADPPRRAEFATSPLTDRS